MPYVAFIIQTASSDVTTARTTGTYRWPRRVRCIYTYVSIWRRVQSVVASRPSTRCRRWVLGTRRPNDRTRTRRSRHTGRRTCSALATAGTLQRQRRI